jgi:hypothetical protein
MFGIFVKLFLYEIGKFLSELKCDMFILLSNFAYDINVNSTLIKKRHNQS